MLRLASLADSARALARCRLALPLSPQPDYPRAMPFKLANPPRLPLIAPSVLSSDFGHMADDCKTVLSQPLGNLPPGQGVEMLHLDVMDGHFVPNLTLGPDCCKGLRRAFPDLFLDVHLMVTNPERFIEPFAKAGANHISFHIEVVPTAMVKPLIERIHALGCEAGVVINPPTPVEAILPVVEVADLILVMSVNPGYSGQAFIPESLEKTRTIKHRLRPTQRLQMDGGVSPKTVASVLEAGCDVIVAGSALMGVPPIGRPAVIADLRGNSGR
jgi:ribulose-phosphate 3-epimerase